MADTIAAILRMKQRLLELHAMPNTTPSERALLEDIMATCNLELRKTWSAA